MIEQTENTPSPFMERAGVRWRLTLDVDGVYWGASEIHPDDAIEGDVVLDHMPDNAPGKYRWDPAAGALVALPLSQQKEAYTVPSLDRVLYDFFSSHTGELPKSVQEWLTYQRTTLDNRPG